MSIDDLQRPDDDATTSRQSDDTPATPDATYRDMSEDAATLPRHENDIDATVSRQADDNTTTVSQQTYTLTVEDVAVALADHNVYRDPRTIQRWCKSGRLDCMVDQDNGERYLITPKSLEKIVAALTVNQERMSRRQYDTPRHDATTSRQSDDTPATPDATVSRQASRPNPQDHESVASEPEADYALKKRISELETELAMTKADKQVREQMVDYLKEEFSKMLDGTLERAEEIGKLREENSQLRNLLLSAPSTTGDSESASSMYNTDNETHRELNEEEQFSAATPLHDDISSGADRAWAEHQ